MHPELETITGKDNIREALGAALQEAWTLIGKDNLIRECARTSESVQKSWRLAYKMLDINKNFLPF